MELETLKYVSYGSYLPDLRVVFHARTLCEGHVRRCLRLVENRSCGVQHLQEDITAYGKKRAPKQLQWRACLISCNSSRKREVSTLPVSEGFLRPECAKFSAKACTEKYGKVR